MYYQAQYDNSITCLNLKWLMLLLVSSFFEVFSRPLSYNIYLLEMSAENTIFPGLIVVGNDILWQNFGYLFIFLRMWV